MLSSSILLYVALSASFVTAAPGQAVLQVPATKPRQLRGRFLQITDIHPDPYYTQHASISKACHRKKPKKKKKRAGFYGTPYSDCDSPFSLTNFTLDFLDEKWASEIDFVIWTGDNARHDNDRKLPRTTNEIYDLNRAVARKMEKVFTSKGIPVVPSLGNNDVWPHNILAPGPNSITSEFSSIWKSFIPFYYHQVFQRGAYYSVEVVPDALAVISLNTMYFYDSNKAVGGCSFSDPGDPGNLQFDWLEVQLKLYRDRGMQVWLTGHVPPSRGNYFPECYVRYVELALRFQDTIVGHLYGHMNADHFFFVEAVDLELDLGDQDTVEDSSYGDLCDALLDDFGSLPKSKKTDLGNYAVINVSPPVVPNPYLPTFRIFAYNVSGAEDMLNDNGDAKKKKKKKKERTPGHDHGEHGNKKTLCKKKPYRDSWKCNLNQPWFSDAEAPSRSNQLWTPLGYAQYYIPDLFKSSKKDEPHFKLEYTTLPGEMLQSLLPQSELPKTLVNGSKEVPYEMEDLTIGSWVELARRLGDLKEKKLRKRFRNYMYLGGAE